MLSVQYNIQIRIVAIRLSCRHYTSVCILQCTWIQSNLNRCHRRFWRWEHWARINRPLSTGDDGNIWISRKETLYTLASIFHWLKFLTDWKVTKNKAQLMHLRQRIVAICQWRCNEWCNTNWLVADFPRKFETFAVNVLNYTVREWA